MPRRIGRPGLLGTMARTAVITGTASAVSRSMNRAADTRMQTQADAEAYRTRQAAPPPPSPAAGEDMIAKLKQLGELHAAGVINDDEFAAAKAKLFA